MYERIGGFSITRGTLPAGDAGTRKTLGLMKKLVLEGSKQIEVREAALDALRAGAARPHDIPSQIRAVFRFVRDRIRFVRDPLSVEWLQGPRYTLKVMAGDCDDRATLLAALLRAVGVPADLRFRVIAANPSRPRSFSHVYVVAKVRDRDVALDPTYGRNVVGYEYAGATRVGDFAL